jgi:hypothetical protein
MARGRGRSAHFDQVVKGECSGYLGYDYRAAQRVVIELGNAQVFTITVYARNRGRMRQILRLFVIRNAGDADREVFIVFSHTMDLEQAKQLAREVAGITCPECEEYQLPADYEDGRLSGVGLLAYQDLIS